MFTVLAPANSVFDNLPEEFNMDNLSGDQLETLISYHIIPSDTALGELVEQKSIQTVQEDSIFIRPGGTDILFFAS